MSRSLSDTQTLLKQAIAPTPPLVLPDTSIKAAIATMLLEGVPISQVMTQNAIALSVAEAGGIYSVLSLLHSSGIHHLLISDEQGNLLGVVTGESLRAALKPTDLLQRRCVEEIMTTAVLTAPTIGTVFQVAQLIFIEKHQAKIEVESVPSQTRFTVSLPFNLSEETNHA